MFSFSVMKSAFCFAYAKLIAAPATIFVDNFSQLRTVQTLLSWKEGFDGGDVMSSKN